MFNSVKTWDVGLNKCTALTSLHPSHESSLIGVGMAQKVDSSFVLDSGVSMMLAGGMVNVGVDVGCGDGGDDGDDGVAAAATLVMMTGQHFSQTRLFGRRSVVTNALKEGQKRGGGGQNVRCTGCMDRVHLRTCLPNKICVSPPPHFWDSRCL